MLDSGAVKLHRYPLSSLTALRQSDNLYQETLSIG